MRSFVNLQILTPGKNLPTPRKRTRKGLLPSMHPNMVHQLVFRLERPPVPGTILPETRVRRTFRTTNMLHCQMGHNLVHAGEVFPARLPRRRLLRVHPQTLHLLLDGLTHVPKKRAVHVRRVVRHPHVGVQVLVVIGLGVIRGVMVRPRIQHLVVRRQVRVLVRGHLGVMVEQHRVAGRRLGRREVVVVASEEEVASCVTGVRVQMPHVAVVGLEVMVLRPGTHFGSGHRRGRVLVR